MHRESLGISGFPALNHKHINVLLIPKYFIDYPDIAKSSPKSIFGALELFYIKLLLRVQDFLVTPLEAQLLYVSGDQVISLTISLLLEKPLHQTSYVNNLILARDL
jgi:hypothetical protein